MNDFEALVSSFVNEITVQPVRHKVVMPFMNAHEESVLQQIVNEEQNEFFETRAVERAFISLRADRRYSRYAQEDIDRMYNLVRRYIHLMGPSYMPSKTHFRIDDMSCRSIEVRYSQRSDVSLNLYVSDVEEGETDYDETYLSYNEDGKSILVNDTMDRMVTLVKALLEV